MVIAIVVFLLYSLFSNTIHNLEARGIRTSFSFLGEIAGFQIGFSPFIEYILGEGTYLDVFFIGILNTMLVSLLGIISATILGVLVGVLRLSPNWLVSKTMSVYIEVFRNIPLLLQIMFWHFVVFLAILPVSNQSWTLGESLFLNNRGINFPMPMANEAWGMVLFLFALLLALGGAIGLFLWARKRQALTGQYFPAFWSGVVILTATGILAYLLFNPFAFDYPQPGRFNFQGGGRIPLPLFSLWFALTIYTAAFVAENVRGGILAVPKGQTEAASSLGLTHGQLIRLVILPQASRVIIPPTISQYLNLTKNSSLAVAISYEELVNIFSGIALNQTGQALIIIGMTILVYELLSAGTSAFMNFYNKRAQLQER